MQYKTIEGVAYVGIGVLGTASLMALGYGVFIEPSYAPSAAGALGLVATVSACKGISHLEKKMLEAEKERENVNVAELRE